MCSSSVSYSWLEECEELEDEAEGLFDYTDVSPFLDPNLNLFYWLRDEDAWESGIGYSGVSNPDFSLP